MDHGLSTYARDGTIGGRVGMQLVTDNIIPDELGVSTANWQVFVFRGHDSSS